MRKKRHKTTAKDWSALLQLMQSMLASENEVADFIAQQFQSLAGNARTAGADPQKITALREQLADFRTALKAERQKLIEMEIGLYEVV